MAGTNGGPPSSAQAPPHIAVKQQGLKQLRRDLAKRRAAPYLTSRDVHRLVVVARTAPSMCRFVELEGVRGGVDPATGLRWVGLGLGHIVALYHCPSSSYQIH